jgi:N-acetylglutamate synthase-like GNAT family acetyltransferase
MNNLPDMFSFDDFTMRRATSSDVEKLVDIINDAYSYQDKIMGKLRTSSEHLSRHMLETDFYVVENYGEIVACFYIDAHDKSLHFGLLTVISIFRGKGIAKDILNTIEKFAKKVGYDIIELDYMSIAPWLRKYYERYGFNLTGDEEIWGPIKLIRMKKTLQD